MTLNADGTKMTQGLYKGPILLAAGGTGGHMFPAQALAEQLRKADHQIILITDARGMRYTDGFAADHIVEISAANPNVRGLTSKMSVAFKLSGGLMRALQEIKRHKPIAAVGFGGYPSLPAMQAASIMKVPYGLHEQNSQLGRANRFLGAKAQFLAHAFPILGGVPSKLKNKQIEVGNPVREQVQNLVHIPYEPSIEGREFRLVITGGSQGASLFSKAPVEAISSLPNHLRENLSVVHQVRAEDQEEVEGAYKAAGVNAHIASFFTDLPERVAASHLLVARAGASTVTEISTLGRPAILVPLAIAMDDHQTMNAQVLTRAGAAEILAENEFNAAALRSLFAGFMTQPQKLVQMAERAKGQVKTNAAQAMVSLVEKLIEG